jgi:hypothetical protein
VMTRPIFSRTTMDSYCMRIRDEVNKRSAVGVI